MSLANCTKTFWVDVLIVTKLIHEALTTGCYYTTYITPALNSSSLYSELYITALCSCAFKCHLICVHIFFLTLCTCLTQSLPAVQTVCLFKCSEQLKALQYNQIVRLRLASRCSLSDGSEVQQMVAKLCFSTEREDDSFILNLSRWPGQPFSIYSNTHTHTQQCMH